MIEFVNPWMLGGVAVALVPVVIHLIHRNRFRQVGWGGMRFLAEVMIRLRRRLLLEKIFILVTRIVALLCLSLALTRPLVRSHVSDHEQYLVRSGRTAAVLLIDDSLSSSAGHVHPQFEREKELARAYLDTLQTGDEVSIITASRLGSPQDDPLVDLEAVKAKIDSLTSSAVASDYAALFYAGLDQLARHQNPHAEIVFIHDGAADGWHSEDAETWDELRRRLRGSPTAIAGTHAKPNVIILESNFDRTPANLGVANIRCDHAVIPAGRPIHVRVEVSHHGATVPAGAILRLSIDGRAMNEKRLDVIDGVSVEVSFEHVFNQSGSHLVSVELIGIRDLLSADNSRSFAVEVERNLPVLLVEEHESVGLTGSLGFVAAALDPTGDRDGLFTLTRIGVAALGRSELSHHRVVVLGDLPALDAADVARLERFLVSGGGILVVAGPSIDQRLANRFWARGGYGFMPTDLGELVLPEQPTKADTISTTHPVFAPFIGLSNQVWQLGTVRCYHRLELPPTKSEVNTLMTLDNGDALIVERERGLGRVITVGTTLDPRWNNLPKHSAFVPLMRGMITHLGSAMLPPRNLHPGERLVFNGAASAESVAHLDGPVGEIVLEPGHWEGRQALLSPPLMQLGNYTVRAGVDHIRYAVAAAPLESRLEGDRRQKLQMRHNFPVRIYTRPQEIIDAFSDNDDGVEIWHLLAMIGIAMLVLEVVVTGIQARVERRAAGITP